MINKKQLDKLVECGAIYSYVGYPDEDPVSEYFGWIIEVSAGVDSHSGFDTNVYEDMILLTAHLKRFLEAELDKIRPYGDWGLMVSHIKRGGYDVIARYNDGSHAQEKHSPYIYRNNATDVKDLPKTELEAIVNACIAVCEGGQ